MKKLLATLHLLGMRYKLVTQSDAYARTYNHKLTNLDNGKTTEFVKVRDADLEELQ